LHWYRKVEWPKAVSIVRAKKIESLDEWDPGEAVRTGRVIGR